MVEDDCLQCDVNKSLLLLILPKHPSFGTGWQSCLLAVYQAFPTYVLQFKDGVVFFSVEVQVVENPICELLTAVGYSIMAFLELFSFHDWWFFFGSLLCQDAGNLEGQL
jgi:hypothetical protein